MKKYAGKTGGRTLFFKEKIYISGHAAVAGRAEAQGPFGAYYDYVVPDALWGEASFEHAERKLFLQTVRMALSSAHLSEPDVLAGGDLLNQIISAGFCARELGVPYLGLYSACATMAQALLVGGMLLEGGFAENAVCATASHFAAAERQYRFPLELGTPKTPTSQNTATAAGAVVLSKTPGKVLLREAVVGCVADLGVTDANNMGAAMAPAAAQTILTHLAETGRNADSYDLIITGDLGAHGTNMLLELCDRAGTDISGRHMDCGARIFEGRPGVNSGGSGAGCGAGALAGYVLTLMEQGQLGRVLFAATGALHSLTSALQGDSIPAIAHAVVLEKEENG